MSMDYVAWDKAIQDAIVALDDKNATSRSQIFVRQFPTCLTQFRAHLKDVPLALPLGDFQQHPTYLLRWLLAHWMDEEKKVLRGDVTDIIEHASKAVQFTQQWRSGTGENWSKWGYKDMEDLYRNYKTPKEIESRLEAWYIQRFCGLDTTGHPIHVELLPNNFQEDLILPVSIRRVVNNEHTLRHRLILLNPAPEVARNGIPLPESSSDRTDALGDPILGVTWVLDARRLSVWYSAAIYKTASALLEHTVKITSAHYPEQGFRAHVLNLGVVFGSLYNMAMKATPATTQATTKCYIGKDVMEEVMGSWDNVPSVIRNPKQTRLTDAEELKFQHDRGPFVVES